MVEEPKQNVNDCIGILQLYCSYDFFSLDENNRIAKLKIGCQNHQKKILNILITLDHDDNERKRDDFIYLNNIKSEKWL